MPAANNNINNKPETKKGAGKGNAVNAVNNHAGAGGNKDPKGSKNEPKKTGKN
jgi:hypothetical protein